MTHLPKETDLIKEIHESEQRYRALLEILPDAVLIHSEGIILYLNAAALKLLDFPSKEGILYRSLGELKYQLNIKAINPRQIGVGTIIQLTRADGLELEIEYLEQNISFGGLDAYLLVGRDVTQRSQINRELALAQGQLHNLIQSVGAGMWSMDIVQNKLLFVSEAFKRMFNLSVPDMDTFNQAWQKHILEEDLHLVQASIDLLQKGMPTQHIIRFRNANGEIRHNQSKIIPVMDESGTLVRLDSILFDVTDTVHAQQHIEYLAFHDELTGLPNRRLFHKKLTESAERAAKQNARFAIVYLDLDKFKNINDSLGHLQGDIFLKSLANRFTAQFDTNDTIVSRLGGDEFTLIVYGFEEDNELQTTIQQIQEIFREPYIAGEHEFLITASIGIAIYPEDGTDVEILMNYADTAMFIAKETRNGYRFHNPESTKFDHERILLQNELQKALALKQFHIVYQPKYRISDQSLIGAEALIRWNHPALGFVSPVKFIPIAEDIGLISVIGDWMLGQVCTQIRIWQDQGSRIPISVNLSVKQFRDDNIIHTIRQVVESSGILPQLLELEITESMAMDIDKALPILQELNRIGVLISVDDFGTGYSSLNYLKKLPIHQLKIDKSFIKDINSDHGDAAIVSTVVSLAHNFNLKVIAEGVENVEQLNTLQLMNCDEAQGYYFHKPMSTSEFNHLLAQLQ